MDPALARGIRDGHGACCAAMTRRTTSPPAACPPPSVPPHTPSTATCARPISSSTARAGPPRPTQRRAALDAWEAAAAAPRAPDRAARSTTPPPATRLPLGELQHVHALDARGLRGAGPDRHLGASSRPTWTARPAPSAGSWPRCSALPPRHHADLGRLGVAFQLANFIRDVREDRRLDRIYLPAEDRDRFGVTDADLVGRQPGAARPARPRGRARPRPVRLRPPGDRRRARLRSGRASASPSACTTAMLRTDPPGVRGGVPASGTSRAPAPDGIGAAPQPRSGAGPHVDAPSPRPHEAAPRATALRARLPSDEARDAPRRRANAAAADPDVLICGASFAGLAAARELKGRNVLIVDRYEIGERATSACAAPTPWLHAMGVQDAIRQEIPCMAFHTPHGQRGSGSRGAGRASTTGRSASELYAQTDARFEIAKVEGRTGQHGPHRPRRPDRAADHRRARLEAGARRHARPAARTRRYREASRSTRTASRHDLDVWIDRTLVRYGYAWSVPADGEQRIGVGSYEPTHHVKEPTKDIAAAPATATPSATRATGSRTSCGPPPRTACSSPATAPATASRSRARASGRRSTSGSPPRARSNAPSTAGRPTSEALRRYARVQPPPRTRLRARAAASARDPAPAAEGAHAAAEADGPRAPVPDRVRLVPRDRAATVD